MITMNRKESTEQIMASLMDELKSCVDRPTALRLLKRCHRMGQISSDCHESLIHQVCEYMFPH